MTSGTGRKAMGWFAWNLLNN